MPTPLDAEHEAAPNKIRCVYRDQRRRWKRDRLTVAASNTERGEYIHLQSDAALIKMRIPSAEKLALAILEHIDQEPEYERFTVIA